LVHGNTDLNRVPFFLYKRLHCWWWC